MLVRKAMRTPLAIALLALLPACSSGGGDHSSTSDASTSSDGTGSAPADGGTLAPADGGDGGAGGAGAAGDAAPLGGLGAASFAPGDLDPPSHGGTITFQQIGATGWYPSRRDPATGPCDAEDAGSCCMAKYEVTSDRLTPWDEELVMTLRGPMQVKQLAVYQPSSSDPGSWQLVSGWDDRAPGAPQAVTFSGKATPDAGFAGGVGSECQIDLLSSRPYACGAGSSPYCPASSSEPYYGWAGSKLFVLLATMRHAGTSAAPPPCSTTTTGNWYDASWVGLAVGELARAGAYASCQCFAKDPSKWYLADGCGQFNVFEVVNDNDSSKNLDVFSTDLIDYSGYVGQGPCGPKCAVSGLAASVDLIDKTND